MSKGVISIDVDGVLANFTRAFTRLGYQLFKTPVSDNEAQQFWMFEDFPELGLTKVKCAEIWKIIKSDPYFWAELDPLNISLMHRINSIKNRIFITNRPGIATDKQTVAFLERWGVYEPVVLVAEKKAPVAVEYNVVAHLDDYIVNCEEIKAALPNAYVALVAKPYNEAYRYDWQTGPYQGEVVLSADDFFNKCDERGLIEWAW